MNLPPVLRSVKALRGIEANTLVEIGPAIIILPKRLEDDLAAQPPLSKMFKCFRWFEDRELV